MSQPFVRRAHWISRSRGAPDVAALFDTYFGDRRADISQDRNGFWYFRKAFDLAASPREAIAHVSADGRYHLYVNGTFVGRGPARCDPAFQSFDTRDITPHLRAGRNVVAILLHSYGRHMSWYQLPSQIHLAAFGCGSIFFQSDVALADGTRLEIDSDGSWRWRKADAWQQDTMFGPVGFMEVFDARNAIEGWAAPDLDDSDWEPVGVPMLGALNLASPQRLFPVMVPRGIPFLSEEERLPAAIVGIGEIEPVGDAADPFEQAEREAMTEATPGRVEGAEALPKGGPATIAASGTRDAAIIVDFGDTVTGYPRLDVTAPSGAIIDIAYSERLRDGKPELPARTPLMSSTVHRYITRDGRQVWEKFEWAGFRYLQVVVRNPQGPVVLHKVAVNDTTYPVEERGPFECSDPLLERIWQAGAKTVRRCMHDGYEDCPSREQRQWVGDVYVEALTNYAAFGDTQLVARALRQVSQSQRPDGMTAMATPGDLTARSIVTIPDWGLCWVFSLGRYVEYTGDLDMAEELLPSVLRLLDWFQRFVDENGLLDRVPEWNFVDWAQVDRRGESTAYNALYYHALRVTEDLAHKLDMQRLAARCARRAEGIRAAINTRLWDEERGVYVDACVDGQQSRRISQQSNAVCIAYGIAPEERWGRIFDSILDESRLVITPTGMTGTPMEETVSFDEERNVVTAQPYFMHHVHRALVAAGRYDDLVRNIRQRWGAMLEAGATTIWEVWNPLVSQCHGWSTTPTFDLSTEVLGIAPLEPGFARVRIAPHPVDLEWARGVLPTVKGDIHVAWERMDGGFKLAATVPADCTVEVALPPRRGGWREVHVDEAGDVLSDERARARAGIKDVVVSGESVTLVADGPWEIEVKARA